MKSKRIHRFVSVFFCLALMIFLGIGCATAPTPKSFPPYAQLNQKVASGNYVPKIKNFMIIFDGSGSMKDPEAGKTRLAFSKRIVSRINQAIPDIPLIGALRTFGRAIPINQDEATDLVYWPVPYSKKRYEKALHDIRWAYGESSLDLALNEAVDDLKHLKGNTAVIIVSDGKIEGDRPVLSAGALKDTFGDQLCIYAVHVVSNPEYEQQNAADRNLLDMVTQAGECGITVSSDSIDTDDGLVSFIERIFLAKDTDGDTIADEMDRCPETAPGTLVDTWGCPMGSAFSKSIMPAGDPSETQRETTPSEASDTAPLVPKAPADDKQQMMPEPILQQLRDLENLLFSQGEATINPYAHAQLDAVARYLSQHPSTSLKISGHGDSVEPGGKSLSEKRVQAVKTYLTQKGIAPDRIHSQAYGIGKPKTSNLSAVGQAVNRRIEFEIISESK